MKTYFSQDSSEDPFEEGIFVLVILFLGSCASRLSKWISFPSLPMSPIHFSLLMLSWNVRIPCTLMLANGLPLHIPYQRDFHLMSVVAYEQY